MMTTIKIKKWNRKGLRAIRYGDADRRVITYQEEWVERVAATANAQARAHGFPNPKYATGSRPGRRRPQGRWRTSVVTGNWEAMKDNSKYNTLTKAFLGSGRG